MMGQPPADGVYDYVVVGSGAGGGTVAARLAEGKDLDAILPEAFATVREAARRARAGTAA